MALLIFLRLGGERDYSRSRLAELLWGDDTESKARHSLTQSLRRLRAYLDSDALFVNDRGVRWLGDLPCDAAILEAAFNGGTPPDSELGIYRADFLQDFSVNNGAQTFAAWAGERRAYYRMLAVKWLHLRGEEAESDGRWYEALQLGLRVTTVEPIFEAGHRRVIRAWTALGERNLALKHYYDFAYWLQTEIEAVPDPMTQSLADSLRV